MFRSKTKWSMYIVSLFVMSMFFMYGAIAAKMEKSTEKIHKKIGAGNVKEIVIQNHSGSINLHAGSAGLIEIKAQKTATATTSALAQKIISQIAVETNIVGDKLFIKSKMPHGNKEIKNMRIDYDIYVDNSQVKNIKVTGINGDISANSLNADIEFILTNGNVNVAKIAGNSKINITNGETQIKSALTYNTSHNIIVNNGTISVKTPKDSSVYIKAKVEHGGIETNFPIKVRSKDASSTLSKSLNKGKSKLTLEVENGNIDITSF